MWVTVLSHILRSSLSGWYGLCCLGISAQRRTACMETTSAKPEAKIKSLVQKCFVYLHLQCVIFTFIFKSYIGPRTVISFSFALKYCWRNWNFKMAFSKGNTLSFQVQPGGHHHRITTMIQEVRVDMKWISVASPNTYCQNIARRSFSYWTHW